MYLHSQFLPTWLQRQAHSHSMRKSCQAVPAWTLVLSRIPVSLVIFLWHSFRHPAREPAIQVDRQMVENCLSSPIQQAAFLAATSQHSGDWLFALPIASCVPRLDDDAVRLAIEVRLGLQLCIPFPHRCRCGAHAHGRHSFICK